MSSEDDRIAAQSVVNSEAPTTSRESTAAENLQVDKYNVEEAEALANEASLLPISEAVPIYEQLISTFPTAAKFWKQYVEAQMDAGNDDATKLIFSRCLLNCLQISLWRCYMRFIRKFNEKRGGEGLEETRKAFDFMLSYVGTDISCGPVWMEYIAFLKLMPAMTAQEESQRMIAIRKAYQKAIVTPTHHLEQLWKDYENFENSVSRTLAKGLLSEYQPKYNSARAVYREKKKYIDEIDWNMLAIPPAGSCKEEQQYLAWKRFLSFEKGNPQRVDSASSVRRVTFTYEQCLMYLYHYPDIWYDYATSYAKSGAVDSAIKIFQRALKALPDIEVLRYAYAELEESRGAIQPAKKVYEGLLANGAYASALAHIQFIRFLRRTEGVEAARKYFLDARKSPNCTYHVYVAYAVMAFCLDKDPKVAHNIFEAGLKRFMHEPCYILEYADFLCHLNDDRNVRALFERALSLLPPVESVEVWKRFTQFEQTFGDLASILKFGYIANYLHNVLSLDALTFTLKELLKKSKVEQRRKEALSKTNEEPSLSLEGSLHDVVSRYSFMDLWPCSSKELDHLALQEWLANNMNKKFDKSGLQLGASSIEKSSIGSMINTTSTKIIFPDTSQMMVYDPRQKSGSGFMPNAPAPGISVVPAVSVSTSSSNVGSGSGGSSKALDEILKVMAPTLVAFIANLPVVEGPVPDVDIVLSILLQNDMSSGHAQPAKIIAPSPPLPAASGPSTSDLSTSMKARSNQIGVRGSSAKRKDLNGREDDDTVTVQSQPLPRDVFRLRQIQKARKVSSSQTGSAASGGSAFSGEPSGSSG